MQKRISESEWIVLEVLWNEHPMKANDIVTAIKEREWNHRTVKTLLARLVKKGVIDYNVEGKTYLYYPLYERDEIVEHESKNFLNRIFKGMAPSLLAHFVKKGKLNKKDIKELKNLLEEHEKP